MNTLLFPKQYHNRQTISLITERYTPRQVLVDGREVASPAIRNAAVEVSSCDATLKDKSRKGTFFARFEYIRDSPTPRQSGITDDTIIGLL